MAVLQKTAFGFVVRKWDTMYAKGLMFNDRSTVKGLTIKVFFFMTDRGGTRYSNEFKVSLIRSTIPGDSKKK